MFILCTREKQYYPDNLGKDLTHFHQIVLKTLTNLHRTFANTPNEYNHMFETHSVDGLGEMNKCRYLYAFNKCSVNDLEMCHTKYSKQGGDGKGDIHYIWTRPNLNTNTSFANLYTIRE